MPAKGAIFGAVSSLGNVHVPAAQNLGIRTFSGQPSDADDSVWIDLEGQNHVKTTGVGTPIFATWIDDIEQYQWMVGDRHTENYHWKHDCVVAACYIHPHFSFVNTLITGGTVTFRYKFTWAKGHSRGVFHAQKQLDHVITVDLPSKTHMINDLRLSAATADATHIGEDEFEPDAKLIVRIELLANNVTVSSGGVPNPFVHGIDLHVQSRGWGTLNRVPNFYA